MKVIVDTTVWIEFLRGHDVYHAVLVALIERGQAWALESVFGELLQGARAQRERAFLEQFWVELPKVDIPRLFLLAGKLASEEHYSRRGVGLIDASIVVAARSVKGSVWSLDKKLNAVLLDSERYALASER